MASQADARRVVEDLTSEFRTITVDANHVLGAIEVNMRYGYSYWDSLIIATALQNDCSILYSEDMQHNQLIEGKLRIINPLI
jgi:predicted nucleic acid-binding protein